MIRPGTLLVACLAAAAIAVAPSARAAETTPAPAKKGTTSKDAKGGSSAAATPASKDAAASTLSPAEKMRALKGKNPNAPPAPPNPKLNAVVLSKKAFVVAARLCDYPEKCDEKSSRKDLDAIELLAKKQVGFMDACKECASTEECEAERAHILEGSPSRGAQPCK